MRKIFYALIIALPFVGMSARTLVHPGLSHKKSDLERMRYMVSAGVEPWKSSFNILQQDASASYNYVVKGNSSMTTVTQDGLNYTSFSKDVQAAYLNSLMWAITGDTRHADKCVQIFNAWKNLTCFTGDGTESLNTGRVIWKLLEAAEIIKSTYDGWSSADIQKFKDMLVYPGYSTTQVPTSLSVNNGTFYWRMYNGDPGRHGNQDLFGFRGIMAMGVFMDNDIMYERALRYFKGLPHRPDDLPYQSGPPIASNTPDASKLNEYYNNFAVSGFKNDSADYGYNGVLKYYIWENGQCQESSRDQDHAVLGMGMYASLAEIAWNQGDDLYSMYDNRILKGYEFALKYNVSLNYKFDDQPSPWEPTVENGQFIRRKDRTGRWESLKVNPYNEGSVYGDNTPTLTRGTGFKANQRPIYEIVLAHYRDRMGSSADSMKWTERAHDISETEGYIEQNGWSLDHLGWGGLTVHRVGNCPGDPVNFSTGNPVFKMPVIIDTIQAENYDFFTADGEGIVYHDLTNGNSGKQYRRDDVDIDSVGNTVFVNGIEDGEWLSYTVEVPADGNYDFIAKYSASSDQGKLQIFVDGQPLSAETQVPFGGEWSTGLSDWKNFQISALKLTTGVHNIKLLFSGVSNSFQVDNFVFNFIAQGQPAINLNATNKDAAVSVSWTIDNILVSKVDLYRNTTHNFSTSSLIAENVGTSSYLDPNVVSSNTYYYWLKVTDLKNIVYVSDSIIVRSTVGRINDTFETGANGWVAATDGASVKSVNNQLVVTLALLSTGKYRGDIVRSAGITFHSGNYPILAFKMAAPQVVNIHVDTNEGSYGDGANKWTGIIGNDVYYYDLTKVGFRGYIFPATSTYSFTKFQLKVADITSGEKNYTLDWLKTFESLSALEDFVKTSAVEEVTTDPFTYIVQDQSLQVNGLDFDSKIKIFDLSGRIMKDGYSSQDMYLSPKLNTGIYILHIEQGGQVFNKKINIL